MTTEAQIIHRIKDAHLHGNTNLLTILRMALKWCILVEVSKEDSHAA